MSINLKKEQTFNFNLEKNEIVKKVYMGIGWDPANNEDDVDLDASCILLDSDNDLLEIIDFSKLISKDSAIEHLGDNLTGDGDGDDEVINVDLGKLRQEANTLIFTITSFSGQSFTEIKNCSARLVNAESETEMCKFELDKIGDYTAVIMCKLSRQNGGWEFKAIGKGAEGESADDLLDEIEEL